MKNFSLIFLAILALTFTACEDDDTVLGSTTNVNLSFKGMYSTDPLIMLNDAYKYPDGRQIMFQDVKFFISDVVLLEEEGGDETELIDVEFVDFSANTTLEDAEVPVTFTTPRVPVGTYKGIRIGFGVPADLNNSEANQFGENHPLRKNYSLFWSGWDSFIFTMINGIYDEDGNGIDGNDPGFNHHLGSDPVYKTVTISTPITLEEGTDYDLNLIFDLVKMYETDTELLDLTDPANRLTHSADDLTVAQFMQANFAQAISVD